MLEKFLSAAREEGLLPYGMELRMDDIVAESWEQTPGRRYPVYSAAKSFTASAVGMAVDEGKLSLEDPLERYFEPELNQAGGDTGKFWRQVTIRRLLTMTIPGLPFRPSGDDWLADCFSKMPDLEGGVCFSYSNLPAYLAGVAEEQTVVSWVSHLPEKEDTDRQEELFQKLLVPEIRAARKKQ